MLTNENINFTLVKYLKADTETQSRTILLNLSSFEEKMLLFTQWHIFENQQDSNIDFTVENYDFDSETTEIKKFHNNWYFSHLFKMFIHVCHVLLTNVLW
jgi:hypothetical protein